MQQQRFVEAVQGFYLLILLKGSRCWPVWSRLNLSVPCGWVISQSELPSPRRKPVLCSSAMQGKEKLLPGNAGQLRADGGSLSCLFLLFPSQFFFPYSLLSLLNYGNKVQGDFLKCMSSLSFVTPILPNLLSSMTSFKKKEQKQNKKTKTTPTKTKKSTKAYQDKYSK